MAVRVDGLDFRGPGAGGDRGADFGPQVGLVGVQQAGQYPAVPQVGHAAFEPAPHGLGIDLQARGNVVFAEPRAKERAAQGLVHSPVPPDARAPPTLTEDVPSRPIARYKSSVVPASLVLTTKGDCRTADSQIH